MAGVWKLWKNPKTGGWERTFAVITGEANARMQPIHDRITAFLAPRDYAPYLEPSERPPLHLIRILPSKEMWVRRVEDSPITNAQVSRFDSQ